MLHIETPVSRFGLMRKLERDAGPPAGTSEEVASRQSGPRDVRDPHWKGQHRAVALAVGTHLHLRLAVHVADHEGAASVPDRFAERQDRLVVAVVQAEDPLAVRDGDRGFSAAL